MKNQNKITVIVILLLLYIIPIISIHSNSETTSNIPQTDHSGTTNIDTTTNSPDTSALSVPTRIIFDAHKTIPTRTYIKSSALYGGGYCTFEYKITGIEIDAGTNTLYGGVYDFQIYDLLLMSAYDAKGSATTGMDIFSSEGFRTIVPNSYNAFTLIEAEFITPYLIYNTSASSVYLDDTMSADFNWALNETIRNGRLSTVLNADFESTVFYELDIHLQTNSENVDFDKIRVYTFDTANWAWVEQQDPSLLHISNPRYKLRLTDLVGNILFQDSDFQNYNVIRTINPDLLKIQNNADEPINFEATESNHYQGYESFDLQTPNQNPTGWSYSNDINGYQIIQNEIAGHAKVLELYDRSASANVFAQINFPTTSNTDFECWFRLGYNPSAAYDYYAFILRNAGTNLVYVNVKSNTLYDGSTTLLGGTIAANTWYHLRITTDASTFTVYLDQTFLATRARTAGSFDNLRITTSAGYSYCSNYIDAIDFSFASGYYVNRNYEINSSVDLWDNWNAFPRWNSQYYQSTMAGQYFKETAVGSTISGWVTAAGSGAAGSFTALSSITSHKQIAELRKTAGTTYFLAFRGYYKLTSGTIEYSVKFGSGANFLIYTICDTGANGWTAIYVNSTGYGIKNKAGTLVGWGLTTDWINIVEDWTCSGTTFTISYYINGLYKATSTNTLSVSDLNYAYPRFQIEGATNPTYHYIDAVSYDDESNYFHCLSLLQNATESPIAYSKNITSIQINPYSSVITNFTDANYQYRISDLYNNTIEWGDYYENEEEIIYTPPNTRECFISLSDQQNVYLDWENYKIYINNSLIYENRFYREIGTEWNISIYSRFNYYINSTVWTVDRDENWISFTINRYALKIYNQQSQFLHYNVTLDPNYYPGSSIFWSEWLAPGEIGSNYLSPDYYKIVLMKNETGTPQYLSYALNFVSDDVILISSSNTIWAVLQNLNNINTNINNQFTYVSLNFTNTNSVIGNQTTILNINFQNVNTTFGNLLLSNAYSFAFLNSTIGMMYQQENNTYAFMNSTLGNLYTISSNSFSYTNSSLNNLIGITANSFAFNNASINSISTITANSFSYLNTTLNNSISYMAQNFTFLNSQIGNNQLQILTQFAILNSNITNNSIDIKNSIYAINNTLSNLSMSLSSMVFLVNNSIYTAILNSTQVLTVQNNMIAGNLSFNFQMNPELTAIYSNCLFNENLTWYSNPDLVREQTEIYNFVNKARNDTALIEIKYGNLIKNLTVGTTPITQMMLNYTSYDMEYRVTSLATGDELVEWTPIANNTIEFGTWRETIPATPNDLNTELNDWIMLVSILIIFASVTMAIVYYLMKTKKPNHRIELLDSKTYKFGEF